MSSLPQHKVLEDDRVPLLFVDVNIEEGKTARIVVYEGDKSEDLACKFANDHRTNNKYLLLIFKFNLKIKKKF